MLQVSHDWQFDVDASSEWLFIRLRNCRSETNAPRSLAERIWEVAEKRSIYRFVVELCDDVLLTSELIGQIVLVHKRSHQIGGVTRLCGLSDTNYQSIQTMRLAERFPNYRSREEAVVGYAWQP